jgi:hypothetical protein
VIRNGQEQTRSKDKVDNQKIGKRSLDRISVDRNCVLSVDRNCGNHLIESSNNGI